MPTLADIVNGSVDASGQLRDANGNAVPHEPGLDALGNQLSSFTHVTQTNTAETSRQETRRPVFRTVQDTERRRDTMPSSLWLASDIHDDTDALEAFAGYVSEHGKDDDAIFLLGDLSLQPYTADMRDELIQAQRTSGREDTLLGGTNTPGLGRFKRRMAEHNGRVLRDMRAAIEETGLDYLVIAGNYDPELASYFGKRALQAETAEWGGVKIGGYGGFCKEEGNPPHLHYPMEEGFVPIAKLGGLAMHDENELATFLASEEPDIALIHIPPYGHCDISSPGKFISGKKFLGHVGVEAPVRHLERCIRDGKALPKMILSGHAHGAGPLGQHGIKGISNFERKNPQTGNLERTTILNPGSLGQFQIDYGNLELQETWPYGSFMRVDVDPEGRPTAVSAYISVVDRPNGTSAINQLWTLSL